MKQCLEVRDEKDVSERTVKDQVSSNKPETTTTRTAAQQLGKHAARKLGTGERRTPNTDNYRLTEWVVLHEVSPNREDS